MRLKDSWVGVIENDPYIIWGYLLANDDLATIWCLATDKLLEHRTAFFRISEAWLASLGQQVGHMNCYSDSRNTEHHRWLRLMGFKRIDKPLFFYDPNIKFYEYLR